MKKSDRVSKPASVARKTKAPARSKLPRPKKTVEEIAAEQGVPLDPKVQLELILKRGKGLFRSDEECERFVADIYERRRRGR